MKAARVAPAADLVQRPLLHSCLARLAHMQAAHHALSATSSVWLLLAQMLVEAETDDGCRHSTLLQNAETVRLVCPAVATTSSSSSAGSTALSPSGQAAGSASGQSWQAVSVSALQPGQRVYVLLQEGARHTGISIQEQIKEC